MLTTDPNDPRLGRGVDKEPGPQHEVYLVLSEEERNKGFTRPFRDTYKHVGIRPKYPIRDLTDDEKEKYSSEKFVKFEKYPKSEGCAVGRFWTEKQLNSGCNAITKMGYELSATYAREPKYYGSTYCIGCRMHKPVGEFIWIDDGQVVGS